jgi:hypothetical protein
MRIITLEELHEFFSGGLTCLESVITFHGGVKTVALELVNEVFGLFEAVAGEDALAVIVNLHHVIMSLLTGPVEYFLENVSDEIHGVDRIIPADNKVTSFMGFAGFLFRPF